MILFYFYWKQNKMNNSHTSLILDEDLAQGLKLVSAINVTNNSPNEDKENRGLVYDRDSNLVLKTFPHADEYVGTDVKGVELALTGLMTGPLVAYDAYEGTIIRVYNVGGKWNMSTHKKLDAFKSRWSCQTSFGQNFVFALGAESLEQFYSRLNPSFRYVFLLINNEQNRVVCSAPDGHIVYHVGTFNDQFKLVENDDLGFLKPVKHSFTSPTDLCDFVERLNPLYQMGLICMSDDGFRHVKVLNSRYKNLTKFRGNTPSLKYRYLEVRTNHELVTGLTTLFPSYENVFRSIENAVHQLAVKLHSTYMRRYVNKQKEFIILPPDEHNVLKTCLTNRNVRITPETVKEVLNKLSPFKLNQMLNNQLRPDTRPPPVEPEVADGGEGCDGGEGYEGGGEMSCGTSCGTSACPL